MKKPRHLWPASAAVYALLVPTLRVVAREKGYALGLHGSLTTDMDLIAAPWIEEAAPAEELIEALREAVNGVIRERAPPCAGCREASVYCPHHDVGGISLRPHGRRSWSIYLGTVGGPYLDVSVMPLMKP